MKVKEEIAYAVCSNQEVDLVAFVDSQVIVYDYKQYRKMLQIPRQKKVKKSELVDNMFKRHSCLWIE